MTFKDYIKPLDIRITRLKESKNTEEATKTYLVLAYLQTCGYNVRLVGYMVAWLLCLSCAPKHHFYFTPSSYDQKGQLQNLAFSAHQPQASLSYEATLVDSVAFTLTAPNAKDLSAYAPSQALPVIARVKSVPSNMTIGSIKRIAQVTKLPRAINKKGAIPSADKRPVHTLAWLSFLLSLTGLALIFVTSQFAGLPILLSFLAAVITGGIAISKIKKEPIRYSGKGLAQAAIIIVLVMLVAFTLFILAFAGAF